MTEDYREVNRAMWDDRAPAHAASPDYAVDRLVADPAAVSDVVAFDRPRLGDLAGLDVVHLQCHIGTDTLSLAHLGAASVTGLDLSGGSIAEARRIAERAGASIEYHQAEVYDAVEVLGRERFDLVYTGIGALIWLPDIARWAKVVADLLRPGGRLHVREGHPMLGTIEYGRTDHTLVVAYPYFEQADPLIWDEPPETYVETDVELTVGRSMEWNHGLGETITALLDAGLRLTRFEEHDRVPWAALPDDMEPAGQGEHRLIDHPERLPLTYTVQAVKDGGPALGAAVARR